MGVRKRWVELDSDASAANKYKKKGVGSMSVSWVCQNE